MLNETDVQTWVIAYITDFVDVPPDRVNEAASFADMGVDSIDAVVMGGALEERFDIEVDASLFLRCVNIAELITEMKAAGFVAP